MTAPATTAPGDGVHGTVSEERMDPLARRRRAMYRLTPDEPLLRTEFGFMEGLWEAWKAQGMPPDVPRERLFDYDGKTEHGLGGLGWCEAAFCPAFETRVLEDRGAHELVQDFAGRKVLCFKGRRNGFMPEYVEHPVKDMRTWQEHVAWRLDPATPQRWADFDRAMRDARDAAGRGFMISQRVVGGYMYLRSLIGPEEVLYAFYDQPQLVHACMRTWLALADAVTARHQQHVTIDEIFFAEDICYNHGILISPDTMKEFLLPYYQQLIASLRRRQLDPSRHLYVKVDTDGDARPVLPVYREAIALDAMTPFEVASGCDVVAIGRQYPDLVIFGGIDKRVLAAGRAAIDRMVERIFPPMRRRGGYVPCCDHAVPVEVRYEHYLHYRRRAVELGG